MKKISIVLIVLVVILLPGCSSIPTFGWWQKDELEPLPPKVVTVTETVPLRIYQPPLPQEISLENVKFFVITQKNLEEQTAKIEKILGGDFVVFALTPQSYENMAYNLQEIRRYVRQQKEIILYYREATTGDDGTDAEDWIEKNKEVVEQQKSD
tara:strand:+ start:451 stop:912 length:462 start_codon:yes stop_codon:yes gene_type:complete